MWVRLLVCVCWPTDNGHAEYVFNLLGQFRIFIHLHFLVLVIYSKSPEKNLKHCWVTDLSNIMAVSNMAAQLFEQMVGSQFCAIHASQKVHAKWFNLLSSSAFLYTLESTPMQISGNLRVSSNDWDLFKTLKEKIGIISQVMSQLNASLKSTSCRRAGAADDSNLSEGWYSIYSLVIGTRHELQWRKNSDLLRAWCTFQIKTDLKVCMSRFVGRDWGKTIQIKIEKSSRFYLRDI